MAKPRHKTVVLLLIGVLVLSGVVALPKPWGCGAFRTSAPSEPMAVMKSRPPDESAESNDEFWTEERMRNAQPAPMPGNAWCSVFR